MTRTRTLVGLTAATLVLGAAVTASEGSAQESVASGLFAAQSNELWGGPGAKGTGVNARFDTNLYVSATTAASGVVEFFLGGAIAASTPFSIPARGVATLAAPAALDGRGAFLYRVRSDVPVSAWSDTYNETPEGRFGVSVAAFTGTEFLIPGDEANGGGAEASSSTEPGRARTNVGVLCSPSAAQACALEVSVFEGGALLGTGTVGADPGSAAQRALTSLVPASAERIGLALRLRLRAGTGAPYAIRNNNRTSDGIAIPLVVSRSAFSTAPSIDDFTVSPDTICAGGSVTLSWSTTGASRVTISGVSGDLLPSGSTSVVVNATTDFLLTAHSLTGQASNAVRRVAATPAPDVPTPAPDAAETGLGGTVEGLIATPNANVTFQFLQHESTGSTFSLQASSFVYHAGSTPGTDVVKLTATNGCGTATAIFTVTVLPPGTLKITSFTADRLRYCNAVNRPILSWTTVGADRVTIAGSSIYGAPTNVGYGLQLPPTGSQGYAYDPLSSPPDAGSTTFTLTAYGPTAGQKVTKTLTVPVDGVLPQIVGSQDATSVFWDTIVNINFTSGTPGYPLNPAFVGPWIIDRPSGGRFVSFNGLVGTAQWLTGHANLYGPVLDRPQIRYTNGCGTYVFETPITVTPTP